MDQYEYIEEIDEDIEEIVEVEDDIEDIIEVEDDIEYIEEVYKYNDKHDEKGRFATKDGNALTGGGGSGNLQSSSKPEWSKEDAKKPFDYWELSEDKTGFPRHPKPNGFSGAETLSDHFGRHGEGVGAISEDDYIRKAKEFISSPRGKHGDAFVNESGRYGRYDYDTKVMVIAYPNGNFGTYWNLKDDMSDFAADDYWRRQK